MTQDRSDLPFAPYPKSDQTAPLPFAMPDVTCGRCGKTFKGGTAYGYVCQSNDCELMPKAR